MTNDTRFEDAESYSYPYGKDKLTFKDIVLEHLKRIGTFASVEFVGGYWQEKVRIIGGTGMTERVYIHDTREVYSHSIEYLHDILFPYFDEEMVNESKHAKKETDEAFTKYASVVKPEGNNPARSAGDKGFQTESDKVAYRHERTRISRNLFRAICCFLYRKKYLELGIIED